MSQVSVSAAYTKFLMAAAAGVSVAIVAGASYWYYRTCTAMEALPEKWKRIGTLTQINLFPVKSLAPLKLNSDTKFSAEILGLRIDSFRDRGFMLIDHNNTMITARIYPKMVLIETKMLSGTKMQLSAPNMAPIELDFEKLIEESPGKDVHTAVWGTKVDGMLCGEKYDRWFSEYLLGDNEGGVRLVYYAMPTPTRAIVQRLKKQPFLKQNDTGAFPDATSYMLINLASITDLNDRLQRPINPLQFRGNFHLKMDKDDAYAEDNWQWVRIGENVIFRVVAPCTRCIFPNIDPNTGERDPDGEPLKMLRSYRMHGQHSSCTSPVFGIHLGVRQAGVIKANDVVYISES